MIYGGGYAECMVEEIVSCAGGLVPSRDSMVDCVFRYVGKPVRVIRPNQPRYIRTNMGIHDSSVHIQNVHIMSHNDYKKTFSTLDTYTTCVFASYFYFIIICIYLHDKTY